MALSAISCNRETHSSLECTLKDQRNEAGFACAEDRIHVTDMARAAADNPLRKRLRSDGGIEKWSSAFSSIPLMPACPPLRCGRLHGVTTCLPGVPATRKG